MKKLIILQKYKLKKLSYKINNNQKNTFKKLINQNNQNNKNNSKLQNNNIP